MRCISFMRPTAACLPTCRQTRPTMEEELRLAYVAMTRARDHLYVTWPRQVLHTSAGPFGQPRVFATQQILHPRVLGTMERVTFGEEIPADSSDPFFAPTGHSRQNEADVGVMRNRFHPERRPPVVDSITNDTGIDGDQPGSRPAPIRAAGIWVRGNRRDLLIVYASFNDYLHSQDLTKLRILVPWTKEIILHLQI